MENVITDTNVWLVPITSLSVTARIKSVSFLKFAEGKIDVDSSSIMPRSSLQLPTDAPLKIVN